MLLHHKTLKAVATPLRRRAPNHNLFKRLQTAARPAAAAGQAAPSGQAAVPTLTSRRKMAARRQASSSGEAGNKKTSVLFVCLGNICRSPTAEAVFRSVVEKAGCTDQFDIDSCGTGGGSSNWYLPGGFSYHEGDESDPRMTSTAQKRGVRLTSRSRPLQPADLSRFDFIIGMDARNIRDVLKAASYWSGNDSQLPQLEEVRAKISLMTQYCSKFKQANEVPDPYYGGPAGFEQVLDLLDDSCTGLLAHMQQPK